MNISFVTPESGVFTNGRNWLMWVYDELKMFHDITLNGADKDTEVILGMTESQTSHIKHLHELYPKAKLVLYNWDMHPVINRNPRPEWNKLLKEANEIWTQTKYHARYCKERTGLKHIVVPMGAPLEEEFGNIKTSYKNYAVMASRRDAYKGFDLFEKGCREVGISFISCHPHLYSRDEFKDILANCKVLVVASEEEANSPMSAYEGAWLNKPLLLSGISANIEEWGNRATYFEAKDIEDFKRQLRYVYDGKADDKIRLAKARARFFTAGAFARRINSRLVEVKHG